MIFSGCSLPGQNNKKTGDTADKTILMVIAPKDFRDVEFFTPKSIFEKDGYTVKVASIQKGEAMGAEGGVTIVDMTIGDVDVNQFAAIVFVGGSGMQVITGDESLQTAAIKFNKAGKLVAAICTAPEILAKAGILKSIKATSCDTSKETLQKNGADFINQSVVIDNNIITANGPDSANAFGNDIIKKLNSLSKN